MSYAIHPLAVAIKDITNAIGSKDQRLLAKLRESNQEEFEEIDELDDEVTLMPAVLGDLVNGTPLDEDAGFKYGYALKFMCEHFGDMLTNRAWSSIGWEWIEDVDKALVQAGIDGKTFGVNAYLAGRGAPVKLPMIYDFPSIGFLRESEMAAVSMALRPLKLADEEIAASLAEVRSWLDYCVGKHRDLICFYH